MVDGGDPFYLNFGLTDHHWSEIADFEQIIARSATAATPSEKIQLTLIGNALSNEHKTIIVRCL